MMLFEWESVGAREFLEPASSDCQWYCTLRGFCIGFDFKPWLLPLGYSVVAWNSNDLEQKSQQFCQKTVRLIILHHYYCFHKNRAALSVTHIGWEAYPLCKNSITNPFNRDTEDHQRMCCSPLCDRAGSVVLFHKTLQKMVFPGVAACNQVHVFSWP